MAKPDRARKRPRRRGWFESDEGAAKGDTTGPSQTLQRQEQEKDSRNDFSLLQSPSIKKKKKQSMTVNHNSSNQNSAAAKKNQFETGIKRQKTRGEFSRTDNNKDDIGDFSLLQSPAIRPPKRKQPPQEGGFIKKGQQPKVRGGKKPHSKGKGLQSAANQFPYKVDPSDHCETPKEAFIDIAALLDATASQLGKTPSSLKIYDPYYCAGRSARTLGILGFDNVYNRCEDFYMAIENNTLPEFDVVVTNPPFSGDHMERLLKWVTSIDKPFFLLMPNFVYTKDYYTSSCNGKCISYLVPLARGRYKFLPPAWVSAKDGSTSIAKGKTATSPFLAFWYSWAPNLAQVAQDSCSQLFVINEALRREDEYYRGEGTLLCKDTTCLPQEVRGELDLTRKRPAPKIRQKISQLRKGLCVIQH